MGTRHTSWSESRSGAALQVALTASTPSDQGHPLAVVRYGHGPFEPAPSGALEVDAPFLPLAGHAVETWFTPEPPRRGRLGRVTYGATGRVLFGTLRADVAASGTLEGATFALYRELLDAAVTLGFPHLLRIWNAVPRINEDEATPDGPPLERYKLFCRGRSHAFQDHHGPAFPDHLPAASAVGGTGTELVVYFAAAREPGLHLENPRQVAAWAYPEEYGPRSPSFARATVAPAALGELVLISGTASVVGHRSVHEDDLEGQLDETLRNLGSLLEQRAVPLEQLQLLKVYVREPRHAAAVRAHLERVLRGHVDVLYVQGDICRRELLIEIEGTAAV